MSNQQTPSIVKSREQIRQELAHYQHAIWAHWMTYLFSVCTRNDDGSVTIAADQVKFWIRQARTHYDELTEREQASDLEQVDKFIHLMYPQWVSVYDAMPPVNELVLGYDSFYGRIDVCKVTDTKVEPHLEFRETDDCQIIYWTPLPTIGDLPIPKNAAILD